MGSLSLTPCCHGWFRTLKEGDARKRSVGVPGKVACLLPKEAHQRLGLLLCTVGKVAWTCSPLGEMPAPESNCCCERRNRKTKTSKRLLRSFPDSRCSSLEGRPQCRPSQEHPPGLPGLSEKQLSASCGWSFLLCLRV